MLALKGEVRDVPIAQASLRNPGFRLCTHTAFLWSTGAITSIPFSLEYQRITLGHGRDWERSLDEEIPDSRCFRFCPSRFLTILLLPNHFIFRAHLRRSFINIVALRGRLATFTFSSQIRSDSVLSSR